MKGSTLTIMSFSLIASFASLQTNAAEPLQSVEDVFQENCAICHGNQMQGTPQGSALVGAPLKHGASNTELSYSISSGFPQLGMPSWADQLGAERIKSLALWIAEHRDGLLMSNFRISGALNVPTEPIETSQASFQLVEITNELDPLPYSITVLPDDSILVAEKMRGLRLVSPKGEVSQLIVGTPKVYDDVQPAGPERLAFGMGWVLEVAVHPDYADNGWIYLHYSNRCDGCNEVSQQTKRPVSMNALMRGQIKDGVWVDQEVLWAPGEETYGPITDVAAGGRIAFDPEGFVFISVGMKSRHGTQDLAWPGGKIHRIHDDGRIPTDNPFYGHDTALKTIWTYGHRSPQGLEFDAESRTLWGTEHGPRGGDEINELKPGRNYGWPMYSKGQNYNGTEVDAGRAESEVALEDIEQPVVDWTPSPAISSFVLYEGKAFPNWQGQMLVGSLKAADLYRVRIEDGVFADQEKLIDNLARIRDIEVNSNGEVLLLLEHASGGRIVKLVPSS
jgi:glucose/arabinose dehydrogenase/cytochrome c553